MAAAQKDAFLNQLNSHTGIIYKVIRLYVEDEEDRKDLYQEIIAQAWKSFPGFRKEAKFSTWLYRISANTVLSFKRKALPTQQLYELEARHEPSTTETTNEQSELLLTAIRMLVETDRLLVSLQLDGYSNEEMCDIMGLSKSHVAVKLHRVKQQLIRILNPAASAAGKATIG